MTADRLVNDRYFAFGGEPAGSGMPPNAKVTPGWPVALAAVLAVADGDSGSAPDIQDARGLITSMMFLFSLGIVAAIALSGRLLGGDNLGLLAGTMAALYLPFSWAASVSLAEHLGALVLAWCLYVGLRLTAPDAKRSYLSVGTLGALCGLLVMVRPNLVLWTFVPLVFVAVRRLESPVRLVRLAAVGAAGFCLVFTPWWVRNVVVMERFILVKSDYVPASAQQDTREPDQEEPVSTTASMPVWEDTTPYVVFQREMVPWIPFLDVLWEVQNFPAQSRIDYPQEHSPSPSRAVLVGQAMLIYHRILIVLAISSLLFVKRSPRILLLAAAPAAVYVVHWSHMTVRYLYPPMPALVIMASVAGFAFYKIGSRALKTVVVG